MKNKTLTGNQLEQVFPHGVSKSVVHMGYSSSLFGEHGKILALFFFSLRVCEPS